MMDRNDSTIDLQLARELRELDSEMQPERDDVVVRNTCARVAAKTAGAILSSSRGVRIPINRSSPAKRSSARRVVTASQVRLIKCRRSATPAFASSRSNSKSGSRVNWT